jgi:hypothetical protein
MPIGPLLDPVFGPGFRSGFPLEIFDRICARVLQGFDVVHDVARAWTPGSTIGGARVLSLELAPDWPRASRAQRWQ